jgi:hypothetical protein
MFGMAELENSRETCSGIQFCIAAIAIAMLSLAAVAAVLILGTVELRRHAVHPPADAR